MFAAVYISVKSVQEELRKNDGALSLSSIFQNPLFLNLLVSLGSTYVLYFVASFMFFEPWHMFTSVSGIHTILPFTSLRDSKQIPSSSNTSSYPRHTSTFSTSTPFVIPTTSHGELKETTNPRFSTRSKLARKEKSTSISLQMIKISTRNTRRKWQSLPSHPPRRKRR